MVAIICITIITVCTIAIIASMSYRMGLEEAINIIREDDEEICRISLYHRILDICTVYAQDGYTASEAMEKITAIVLEG